MDAADILFRYLKNLLYEPECAEVDISQLPPDMRKLGQGMQLLGKWLDETRTLSGMLAKGDLSYEMIDKENVIAAPMKELQSVLRHLAWQTKQVAKGDYSQSVDFMGDFSEAFNTMTMQLQERREALVEEKRQMEEKNAELERAFELAMAFANYTHNMIFIHSLDEYRELFRNEYARNYVETRTGIGEMILENLLLKDMEEITDTRIWAFEVGSGNGSSFYSVESYPIVWRQKKALVHIVVDDTVRKRKERHMYQLAYVDALTGLFNQRYAMEQMQRWINQKVSFVLSFIDVDYLKYCNDTKGHAAGDEYLLSVVRALGAMGGILCRTGGDEFMLLQTGVTAEGQERKLEKIREQMQKTREVSPRSFSYASCEVPADTTTSLEEYIILADSKMYEYKKMNKKPLKDILYRDDRKPD